MLNYNMPADHLATYLTAYNNAAKKILNGDGTLIQQWLESIATEKNEK